MQWINSLVYAAIVFTGISLPFFYRVIAKQIDLRAKVGVDWLRHKEDGPSWREKWMRVLVGWSRDMVPLGEHFTFFSNSEELEQALLKAGSPYHLRVQDIHGLKIFLGLMGFVLGLLAIVPLFFIGPVVVVPFTIGGFLLPIGLLKGSGDLRQAEISRELPDFLDVVSITLGAGLTLDKALERYVKSIKGSLSEEMGLYNDEVQLGVSRETALKNLKKRTSNPDMDFLVTDMIQALRLGVPFAETFSHQAKGMRKIREERAKTMAQKAGPKLSLVVSLVITPSILVFVVGVLGLSMMYK